MPPHSHSGGRHGSSSQQQGNTEYSLGFDKVGGANNYKVDDWRQVGASGWDDIVRKAHASWTIAKKGKDRYVA